jgi:hypothetical protein
MPLIAFINSYFFTAIFKRYMPEETVEKEREFSPLLDENDEAVEEAIRNLKKQ